MTDNVKAHPLVMVVDDEPLVRMCGAATLEGAGYSVIEAANADEAMTIFERATEVRLLFSDVDMPGSMDGLALAELVYSRWPGIRLLLTSGHHYIADSDIPDDGRFVAKPYSSKILLEHVSDLLDQ